jgi:hypothetical protein
MSPIQTEIIEKYVLLLMEYIHLIHSSEIIKQLDNAPVVFQIGVNAVIHIFKMSFLLSKNTELAGCYTQKGMYCYLEYIEQMNRTNTLHNLENTDAIMFVYDKTLSDLYAPFVGSGGQQQNSFINILSLNRTHTEETAWKSILEHFAYITKTILWFGNKDISHLQRIDLTHEYLEKYLVLYLENPGSVPASGAFPMCNTPTLELLKYISVIQEKIGMSYAEYVDFLDAFYKTHRRILKQKQKRSPTISAVRAKSLDISVFLRGNSYREIVASEYGKSEGWKTTVDFVKWLFV